ncbi:MAG: sigma-70 family RNA polymerase sigma factor [Gammaproteobacteria bacterium]|nr:sigma-70 family RNA polymerase sigma factor [Gammaproteobacteria bacterium]
MDDPSQEQLLRSILEHKRRDSFESLVLRYQRPLLSLIRSRLGTNEQADIEDVTQDTLLQVWLSLTRSTPSNFQAWLYQLARNRCTDWLRSRAKTKNVRDALTVRQFVDRRGSKSVDMNERIDEIADVIENIPLQERSALTEFYFQGFSIAEIAARQKAPPGTIKRRLSYGRDMVRSELEVTKHTRIEVMNTRNKHSESISQVSPVISISKSKSEPFSIDLQEMSWWFVVPRVGDSACWATYAAIEEGKTFYLKSVHSLHAKCAAEIHGRECVEIEIDEKENSSNRSFVSFGEGDRSLRIWGDLTDTEVHWIAIESERSDGKRSLYTFLDEGWDLDFGVCDRVVPMRSLPDDKIGQTPSAHSKFPRLFCDEVYDLRIGNSKAIECMRVFDLESEPTDSDVMIDAYVNRAGRTVLARRYNGNQWAKAEGSKHFLGTKATWAEEFPHAYCQTISGVTFVHYEDFLRVEPESTS